MLADTRPLQIPEFRRLFTGQAITVVGAQLTVVAVPAQIYGITGSSAYVGLTGIFGLVPLVVFGLWGGSLADHLDRRWLMTLTTVGLIASSAALWLQAAWGGEDVWLLLGIYSVQQACFAINQPTRSSIIPKLVPPALLPAASSLTTTVFTAGAIIGPLLGGALIPVVGFSWLYLIDTLTLFATLWAVLQLPPMPVERAADAPPSSPGLRSVWDGFAYLRGHRVLLMSFVLDLVAMVFGMPRALIPEMSHVEFGGPRAGGLALAILFAALPVGAFLGGVFSGWISRVRRDGVAVVVAILVWGVAIVGMGLAVTAADGRWSWLLWLAASFLALGGAAAVAASAFRNAMMLCAATPAKRGLVQGVFIVVVAGGPRIADVLHGLVSPWLGAGPTTALGGVLVVVLTLVLARRGSAFVAYERPSG
jgi:MFS family permease